MGLETTSQDRDTLVIRPLNAWPEGQAQTLLITVLDIHGNQAETQRLLNVDATAPTLTSAPSAVMAADGSILLHCDEDLADG